MANKQKKISLECKSDTNALMINRLMGISNEKTLKELVQTRLDLPISQELRKTFPWPIIQQCWNDQLRIKGKL